MYDRKRARLIKRGEIQGPPPVPDGSWPPDPEPPRGPERTTFQEWVGNGAQLRTSGPGAYVRLDAVLPPRCPPELAEFWIIRGRVPGRVYRSGFILANPDALRREWGRFRKAAEAEGVAS